MRITKTQLRRIIREQSADTHPGEREIEYADYEAFTDSIDAGMGYIIDWDVARQWKAFTGKALSSAGEDYLKLALDANGFLKDDDWEEEHWIADARRAQRAGLGEGRRTITKSRLRRIIRETVG
jgi:hypothetical protein